MPSSSPQPQPPSPRDVMAAWPAMPHWGFWLVAAVLAFWVIGAYNRLVALRNEIGRAWAQIDEQLRRRQEHLPPMLEALRAPLASEPAALDAVLAAHAEAQAAADALRARPVLAPAAAALAAAESALSAALARLLALLDQHPALRTEAAIGPRLRELHDADLRYAFARQLYNDAGATYNAAARQFPTQLVAALFGFAAAGAV